MSKSELFPVLASSIINKLRINSNDILNESNEFIENNNINIFYSIRLKYFSYAVISCFLSAVLVFFSVHFDLKVLHFIVFGIYASLGIISLLLLFLLPFSAYGEYRRRCDLKIHKKVIEKTTFMTDLDRILEHIIKNDPKTSIDIAHRNANSIIAQARLDYEKAQLPENKEMTKKLDSNDELMKSILNGI